MSIIPGSSRSPDSVQPRQRLPEFKPSYNIAPGQQVPVIIREDGRNKVKLMRSGLVPLWAQDPDIGNRMINARSETLAEKSSFKQLLGTHRCLIPADGFYEWRREGKGKVPMRIVMKDRQLSLEQLKNVGLNKRRRI